MSRNHANRPTVKNDGVFGCRHDEDCAADDTMGSMYWVSMKVHGRTARTPLAIGSSSRRITCLGSSPHPDWWFALLAPCYMWLE